MFLIRTLKIDNKGKMHHDRAPGYFYRVETAFECISNNRGDIFEDGYYNYAVIEDIEGGLYPNIEEVQWFYYNRKDRSILTVEKPYIKDDLSVYIG